MRDRFIVALALILLCCSFILSLRRGEVRIEVSPEMRFTGGKMPRLGCSG